MMLTMKIKMKPKLKTSCGMEAHGSSRRLTEMQVLGAIVKVMNKQELVKMKMSNLMRTNMMMTQMRVNMTQMTKLTLNPSDRC